MLQNDGPRAETSMSPTTMAGPNSSDTIDPAIFDRLQEKIDEDNQAREVGRWSYVLVRALTRARRSVASYKRSTANVGDPSQFRCRVQVPSTEELRLARTTQSILSRAHSTPSSECMYVPHHRTGKASRVTCVVRSSGRDHSIGGGVDQGSSGDHLLPLHRCLEISLLPVRSIPEDGVSWQ